MSSDAIADTSAACAWRSACSRPTASGQPNITISPIPMLAASEIAADCRGRARPRRRPARCSDAEHFVARQALVQEQRRAEQRDGGIERHDERRRATPACGARRVHEAQVEDARRPWRRAARRRSPAARRGAARPRSRTNAIASSATTRDARSAKARRRTGVISADATRPPMKVPPQNSAISESLP